MRGSQSWQRDSEQIKRAFQILQRVDLKGPCACVKADSLLTKWFWRERKALYSKENVFSDPERVYTSIIALSFLFSPLCITHDPCLPARTAVTGNAAYESDRGT